MKASDSVNSLTELTHAEKSCFVCLEPDMNTMGEPLVDSKLLRSCGCTFQVHPACWNEWLKEKSDYDCPICRKDSMLRIKVAPNPVMNVVYHEEPRPVKRSMCMKACMCLMVVTIATTLSIAIAEWG
jgi:hypothetical protein